MDKYYIKPVNLFTNGDVLPSFDCSSLPSQSKDLSYTNAKLDFGFDYHPCMDLLEREYVYGITMWMAVKCGRKKHFPGYGDQRHYIKYDGSSPIEVRDPNIGWKLKGLDGKQQHYDALYPWYKGNVGFIGKEILRLDDLW